MVFLRLGGVEKKAGFQKRKNLFVCSGLVLVFAAYAFANLGNLHSPQSSFAASRNQTVTVDFGENIELSRIQFMVGHGEWGAFSLEFATEAGDDWNFLQVQTIGVFAWDFRDLNFVARHVWISPISYELNLLEVGFRDGQGNIVPITEVSLGGEALFDEQHLVPLQPRDYMHSMYFDEIFYPRSAYELIHRLEVYEWTHPHLGKTLISLGIRLFGMTPFGWRFMPVLAGVLVLIPLYFLAFALFKSTFWAAFATFIFAFDFMHFVQSRIATLDVFVLLFIVSMYYFMYQYSRQGTLAPLLFSGIFFGLAVSTKWSALYGAFGLAVILFIILGKRYFECRGDPTQRDAFFRHTRITLACCVGFFIIIPAAIYAVNYIPYRHAGIMYPELGFWAALVQAQIDKFNFHVFLEAEHVFGSYWFMWILNLRPMMFFDNTVSAGIVQGISTFGNPVVWWGGIPALAYTAYRAARRDFTAVFLLTGYLVFLLPWLFFGRVAFIYYYYPNVLFLTLMLAYAIKQAPVFEKLRANRHANRRVAACCFAGLAFAMFLLFYPVISGVPVSADYVDNFLRWPFMRGWVLAIYRGF